MIVDAFIALGGGPDTNGFVNKNHIINIIKNEFELTFDMADFLEEISSSSENLDYKTFCQLFEINGNEDDNKSVASKKSLISVRIYNYLFLKYFRFFLKKDVDQVDSMLNIRIS